MDGRPLQAEESAGTERLFDIVKYGAALAAVFAVGYLTFTTERAGKGEHRTVDPDMFSLVVGRISGGRLWIRFDRNIRKTQAASKTYGTVGSLSRATVWANDERLGAFDDDFMNRYGWFSRCGLFAFGVFLIAFCGRGVGFLMLRGADTLPNRG